MTCGLRMSIPVVSANDSRVLEEAIKDPKHGFPWPPEGFYYLVDSGYPIGASFLPPHKSTHYHAQEFRSNRQLAMGKELYNYRCFGVLKAQFSILSCMANYKQYHQRLVVSACCALHNFIHINNCRDVIFNTWENLDIDRNEQRNGNNGNHAESSASAERRHVREMSDATKREMAAFRDDITDSMWEEYVRLRG